MRSATGCSSSTQRGARARASTAANTVRIAIMISQLAVGS